MNIVLPSKQQPLEEHPSISACEILETQQASTIQNSIQMKGQRNLSQRSIGMNTKRLSEHQQICERNRQNLLKNSRAFHHLKNRKATIQPEQKVASPVNQTENAGGQF